ncbi:MAG: hypothetical protein AB2696_15315 [Candidatus Thiodiazotropha sp.]
MAIPSVPDQVDSDPINVQEKHIKQVDCPNPACDGVLDITNVNIGTKIKCKNCNNVTWLPDYTKKWWEKPGSILAGLLISFIIGVMSSLTASWLLDQDEAEQSTVLPTQGQQQPPQTKP